MSKARRAREIAGREIPATLARAGTVALSNDAEFTEIEIADADFTGANAEGVRFEMMRLAKVDLSENRLRNLGASNTEFITCNASNAHLTASSFHRTAFLDCKLTGMHVADTGLVDVEFTQCRMDFAVLHGMKLRGVVFEDCDLRDADLHDCQFESVRFLKCQLARASFSSTSFVRSDMRKCDLTGLRGISNLRGLRMSARDAEEAAGEFARELGITISSETEVDR